MLSEPSSLLVASARFALVELIFYSYAVFFSLFLQSQADNKAETLEDLERKKKKEEKVPSI